MNPCRPFGPKLFGVVTVTPTSRSGLFHVGASRLHYLVVGTLITSTRAVHTSTGTVHTSTCVVQVSGCAAQDGVRVMQGAAGVLQAGKRSVYVTRCTQRVVVELCRPRVHSAQVV
jgi:hypothetical protein